ncbi:MAG TPA: hypothetical protein VM821_03720 [Abditibacteriaceae bacterium]|nr:hypothetical protein [Abditibacteriaceae bacterium]
MSSSVSEDKRKDAFLVTREATFYRNSDVLSMRQYNPLFIVPDIAQ